MPAAAAASISSRWWRYMRILNDQWPMIQRSKLRTATPRQATTSQVCDTVHFIYELLDGQAHWWQDQITKTPSNKQKKVIQNTVRNEIPMKTCARLLITYLSLGVSRRPYANWSKLLLIEPGKCMHTIQYIDITVCVHMHIKQRTTMTSQCSHSHSNHRQSQAPPPHRQQRSLIHSQKAYATLYTLWNACHTARNSCDKTFGTLLNYLQ